MFSRRRSRKASLTFGAVLGIAALMALTASSAFGATGNWYANGVRVGETPAETSGVSEAAFSLRYTSGGVNFEIQCSKSTMAGAIENLPSGGVLSNGSMAMSTCEYKTPPRGCTIAPIKFSPLHATVTSTSIKYAPQSGTTLFVLTVSGCQSPIYNGSKAVIGSLVASASAHPGSFEFTSTSGSVLTVGGNSGQLVGKYSLSTVTGATLTVGS